MIALIDCIHKKRTVPDNQASIAHNSAGGLRQRRHGVRPYGSDDINIVPNVEVSTDKVSNHIDGFSAILPYHYAICCIRIIRCVIVGLSAIVLVFSSYLAFLHSVSKLNRSESPLLPSMVYMDTH